MREEMVSLLAGDFDAPKRELTLQEIESCPECEREWTEVRDTWNALGDLPQLPVPQRLRDRFFVEIGREGEQRRGNVVPFIRRPAFRWIAQAAAVVIVAGGSYLAGHRPVSQSPSRPDQVLAADARPNTQQIQPAGLRIAESMAVPASAVMPDIEGRPDIRNVKFIDENPSDDKFGVSFDITSHVTITGRRSDESLVKLLSYVVENDKHSTLSRSNAIQWVKDTYSSQGGTAAPEIVGALARVVQNDPHEGTRIKAVDALRAMPAQSNDGARLALIEALRNDPNPAVRIKAIDALANIAATPGEHLDQATVDVLRAKASQNDENAYVRLKAAEALSQISQ